MRYVELFLFNVKAFYVRTLSSFFSVSILFSLPVFFPSAWISLSQTCRVQAPPSHGT